MKDPLKNYKITNSTSIEDEIWGRVIEGSTAALGDLYDFYIDDLMAYGFKICGDKEYTMDCIHDLFVDLYKYKSKLAKTKNVKFYLLLSLKRKIHKKFKKKEILLNHEDVAGSEWHLKDNYTASDEELIILDEIQKETHQRLYSALKKLTKNQQKGIALRFQEEKSYEEIAEILGISVASARTIIYRAIKSLREYSLPLLFLVNCYFL